MEGGAEPRGAGALIFIWSEVPFPLSLFSHFAVVVEHAPHGAPQALPRSPIASLVMGGMGLSDWDRMEGALGSPPLQARMRD